MCQAGHCQNTTTMLDVRTECGATLQLKKAVIQRRWGWGRGATCWLYEHTQLFDTDSHRVYQMRTTTYKHQTVCTNGHWILVIPSSTDSSNAHAHSHTVCTHVNSRHKCQFTSRGVLNPRPTFLTKRVSFFTCPRITFFEFWKTPRCFWYALSFCECGNDLFVSKGTDTQTSFDFASLHVSKA